jgi:hypothetical protein
MLNAFVPEHSEKLTEVDGIAPGAEDPDVGGVRPRVGLRGGDDRGEAAVKEAGGLRSSTRSVHHDPNGGALGSSVKEFRVQAERWVVLYDGPDPHQDRI